MFDYMGAFLFRSGFAHADNVITKRCSKTITWLLLSRLQGNKPHSPEPSGTFRKLHPEPTPAHTGTLHNLPEVASGTYTSTHRKHRNPPEPSGTCLQNPHQHTPEPSRTFRNLPPEPTPPHTRTVQNGTCLRNLHQPTPGPSKTFRNLPLEPTPAHTGTLRNLLEPASGTYTSTHGTLRNLPEPSSGTCSCDPHRHTPELIWAEDPISLRCWGKTRGLAFGLLLRRTILALNCTSSNIMCNPDYSTNGAARKPKFGWINIWINVLRKVYGFFTSPI